MTMLTLQTLYFEDLSVGMTERLDKTVASSDVVGFAEVTGDRNPIHLSEHFAAKTPFGTRIAHGLYTASLISAVLGTRLPGPGAVYISQTLEFPRAGEDRRHRRGERFGRRTDAGKFRARLDLHLHGRRRNRARRRGLGEGAVEKSRRPPAAAGVDAIGSATTVSFPAAARRSSAASRPAACSANRRRQARAATGCRARPR